MIRHPYPGQPVTLRYAKARAHLFPYHGQGGAVVAAGKRGVLVNVSGVRVVVPRGNLVPANRK